MTTMSDAAQAVTEARRDVHEFFVLLAASEADRARAAVARLEEAVRHHDAEIVRAMDPVEIALAGQYAGNDIARSLDPKETPVTAAPYATRMTTNSIDADLKHLVREVRAIAEAVSRFAADVDGGIRTGAHTRLAQDVQQFLIRAIRYDATRDTAELFTSELADTEETE